MYIIPYFSKCLRFLSFDSGSTGGLELRSKPQLSQTSFPKSPRNCWGGAASDWVETGSFFKHGSRFWLFVWFITATKPYKEKNLWVSCVYLGLDLHWARSIYPWGQPAEWRHFAPGLDVGEVNHLGSLGRPAHVNGTLPLEKETKKRVGCQQVIFCSTCKTNLLLFHTCWSYLVPNVCPEMRHTSCMAQQSDIAPISACCRSVRKVCVGGRSSCLALPSGKSNVGFCSCQPALKRKHLWAQHWVNCDNSFEIFRANLFSYCWLRLFLGFECRMYLFLVCCHKDVIAGGCQGVTCEVACLRSFQREGGGSSEFRVFWHRARTEPKMYLK